MYLGATVGAGSSGGIIECYNIFVMIGARRGECQVSSTSGKLNFGVGTGGRGGETSGYGRL